nr:rod shape-determining protein MreD [Bacillus sp. B15-48]
MIIPLLLLFLFVFEGLFTQLFPADLFNGHFIFVPRFLIIALFFLSIYGDSKHGILYGFLFGLLFDIVYTEIIGIYLFLFPLVITIFLNVMKIIQTNIILVSFASILCIALLEMSVYVLNLLIHITNISFSAFLDMRLIPTLILNVIFVLLTAYPIKRQSEKYAETLRND